MPKSTIPLAYCDSSQIHAHGYDVATNTLAIQFKSDDGPGQVYHYPNVSQEQYDAFRNAESLGKHFGAHIKNNPAHPHCKMVPD